MTVSASTLAMVITACVAAQLWLYHREARFQKARAHGAESDYAIAKMRVIACGAVLDAALLLAMTLGGGLVFLHTFWVDSVTFSAMAEIFTVVSVVMIRAAAHRSLAAYKQFVVDRRFDIGRMSAGLFAKDSAFNGALLAIVATLLTAACIAAMEEAGAGAGRWIFVWLVWTCFDWGRSWLYPGTLAHMFDHLQDISDPALTKRIGKLMERSGCRVGKIEVVDTSRRSTHANANVVGFGNTKRVIFLDTLLDVLTRDESVAVMAHELGHAQHSHVIKILGLRSLISAVWIFCAGGLLASGSVQAAFNIGIASEGIILALIWLLTPIVAIFSKPLISNMLRSFEFQADRFVVDHDDPVAMQSALKRLYVRNASVQVTDPLYGFVHNTHPSLQERLERLEGGI